MNELISIIMPVYNSEKYIAKTINSVIGQTYINWELIIVNDGSTDKSMEIIEKSTEQIKEKVKIIKLSQNSGVSNARNTALEQANGRYIAYLDSDDIWKKEKLEKQIKNMQENNYSFTYTCFEYLKIKEKRKKIKTKQVKIFPKSLNYKQALKNTIILTSTVMVDTNKVNKKLLIMLNVNGEDAATWWQVLKTGVTAYGLNEVLTTYIRARGSLSYKKSKAVKRTWNLYRNVEKLPLMKCVYYFNWYILNAVARRIF